MAPMSDHAAAGTTTGPVRLTVDGMASIRVRANSSPMLCRINASLCDRGSHVSLTGRIKTGFQKPTEGTPSLREAALFEPGDADRLVPTQQVVQTIWDLLLPGGRGRESLQGVVILSGATGCGKSDTAQGLALSHVFQLRSPGQREPHLVTCEDPIEPWRIYTDEDKLVLNANNSCSFGINFTAREVRRDVTSLRRAIDSAKRQTPKCFYVGELRRQSQWGEIMEFAGSGHFVIVTTHAGSLTETIARIAQAVKARTPAERGWMARLIRGCIHLVMETVEIPNGESAESAHAIFPSMWVGSGKAVNDLITDGLSSVVPNGEYVFGRHQFLELMETVGAGAHVKQLRARARQLDVTEF